MTDEVLKLETKKRFILNGELGNPYEFNVLPYEGSLHEVSQKFCKNYPGVYVFIRCSIKEDIVSCDELLFCGATDDISHDLQSKALEALLKENGGNALCYYYEPSEEIRIDAGHDILAANSFLLNK